MTVLLLIKGRRVYIRCSRSFNKSHQSTTSSFEHHCHRTASNSDFPSSTIPSSYSKMATQSAVVVQEIGKPVVLSQRAIPEPGPNQVQVKVSVTSSSTALRQWPDS